MDSGRSRTIDEIFAAALEHDPPERAAFLDRVCGDDSELRRVLESLLQHASRGGARELPTVALPRHERTESAPGSLIGHRLGRFEVLSKLGEGGMGEVYLARDSELERRVAIKILPPHLADDAERIHRFRREAVAVSALNHPNILTVHEISTVDGRELLVSELVEGVTLREKLRKGALSVATALDVSVQVARGLAAAHRVGIVHRDIKPENVMIRADGLVKVLDFGLAKSIGPGPESSEVAPQFRTEVGTIVGTISYMSPEQARGETATRQSDIWALGCVLFEMLSGLRPFTGRTMGDVLAAILTGEPDWTALPALPPQVRSLLRRCLAKSLEDRLQDVGDVRLELEEALSDPWGVDAASDRGRGHRRLVWGAAMVTMVTSAAVLGLVLGRPSVEPPQIPIRFELPHPTGGRFWLHVEAASLALSPDGSQLGFITLAPLGGSTMIWIRPLGELEARPLQGTEDAESLFWSPDGKSVGFVSSGKLKRIPVSGGGPVVLCDVEIGAGVSGTWGRDSILFASVSGDVIYRVPAEGGSVSEAVRADSSRDELRVGWPWFLADGERFLYLIARGDSSTELRLATGGESRAVAAIASRVELVDPDLVVFARDGALVAQHFDADRAEMVGAPVVIAPVVRTFASTGWAGFGTARQGTVVVATQNDLSLIERVDAQGEVLDRIGEPMSSLWLSVSPDGRRATFDRLRPGLATYDLWMLDLERGVESQLTDGRGTEVHAVWPPDGRSIIYSSTRGVVPNLLRRDLASGVDTELVPAGPFQLAVGVTPDGRSVIFRQRTERGFELLRAPLDGSSPPVAVLRPGEVTGDAALSPDGRVLAYVRFEQGVPELFVRLFEGGESVRVSEKGAWTTRFSADGRILYYTTSERRLAAVDVAPGPEPSIGKEKVRFDLPALGWMDFAPMPDDTFLALVRVTDGTQVPLTVVSGWNSPGKG